MCVYRRDIFILCPHLCAARKSWNSPCNMIHCRPRFQRGNTGPLSHDQDTIHAEKGCAEMRDFCISDLMFLTGHGIKAGAHACAEIAHFPSQCIFRTWKALSLRLWQAKWPIIQKTTVGFSAEMCFSVGNLMASNVSCKLMLYWPVWLCGSPMSGRGVWACDFALVAIDFGGMTNFDISEISWSLLFLDPFLLGRGRGPQLSFKWQV